ICKSEFFFLRDATNGEVAFQVECVWTSLNDFRDLNVMVGKSFTSKKSFLFNLLFFRPLPVFTLSAWISMSKTPLLTSVDENFMLAFHLSKVPLMGTDDPTSNLIVLSTGVTS